MSELTQRVIAEVGDLKPGSSDSGPYPTLPQQSTVAFKDIYFLYLRELDKIRQAISRSLGMPKHPEGKHLPGLRVPKRYPEDIVSHRI